MKNSFHKMKTKLGLDIIIFIPVKVKNMTLKY